LLKKKNNSKITFERKKINPEILEKTAYFSLILHKNPQKPSSGPIRRSPLVCNFSSFAFHIS